MESPWTKVSGYPGYLHLEFGVGVRDWSISWTVWELDLVFISYSWALIPRLERFMTRQIYVVPSRELF